MSRRLGLRKEGMAVIIDEFFVTPKGDVNYDVFLKGCALLPSLELYVLKLKLL